MNKANRLMSTRYVVTLFALLLLAPRVLAGGTVVVVVGAAGEPEYGREFAKWADRWLQAARAGTLKVELIGNDAAVGTTLPTTATALATTATSQPASDRDRLRAVLAREIAVTEGSLWLVLIGHGTWDGREAKFNLTGPDVTDKELADWLRPARRPLAVIDCTSASGPFLNRLAAKGRVVITATRTGSEIQFARFGDAMSSAIADPAADLDKDGQTSLLEAFLAACGRVNEFYKQNGRLVTEHALLDDNGDSLGVSADWFTGIRATRAAKNGAAIDGPAAHQWNLVPSRAERTLSPERRARRDEIERAIEVLRGQKATLSEDDYYGRLEVLLLEIARLYADES